MNKQTTQSVLRLSHFVFWGALLLLAIAWLASALVPRVPGQGGLPKPTVDFIDAIYKGATPILLGVLALSVIPMALVWLTEDPVLQRSLYRQRHCLFGAVLGIAGLLAWGASVGWLVLDRGELQLAIKQDGHDATRFYGRGYGVPSQRVVQIQQGNEMRLPFLWLLGRTGMVLAAIGWLYFLVSWVWGRWFATSVAGKRVASPAVAAAAGIVEAEIVEESAGAARDGSSLR